MTSFDLKILAIITMFIDHLGFMFFPEQLAFRFIGRIAFPIFAFQLAVGYSHAKNKEKHILGMLIFSIVSQIPFSLFIHQVVPAPVHSLNIGFTLVLGLLGMYVLSNFKNIILKIIGLALVLLLGIVIPIDYGIGGVILCIVFYFCLSSKSLTLLSSAFALCCMVILEKAAWKIPSLCALVPIWLYNGKKGKNIKYFFYIFYPLHMIIFTIIYKLI